MSPAGTLLLSMVVASGCLGTLHSTSTRNVFSHGDVSLPARVDVEITSGSGILVYTIEGGANATFALLGDGVQSTSEEAALSVAMVAADGLSRIWRFDEYAFPREPTGFVAPEFVDGDRATLIITWANLEATQWTLYAMEGARISEGYRGSVNFLPWTEFPGCDVERGEVVPPGTRCSASLGSEDSELYAVVKLRAYPAALGSVRVTDARGERSFAIEPMDQRNPRYFITSVGATRFDVEVGAHPDFRLYVTAAQVPHGVLPDRIWKEFAEPAEQSGSIAHRVVSKLAPAGP